MLADHDEAGRNHAQQVALTLSGITESVCVVELPGLPDKGDVSDWIAAGGTKEELNRLAEAAPLWTPTAAKEFGPILTCLADVEPRPVSWLWPNRIPLGRITLLVGRPGEGKSFLTTDAAARVITGTPWPDGSDCSKGSVILISAEDDPADTIRPRLDAHYADVRRVHLLSAVRRVNGDGHYERLITLADVEAIEAALVQLPDCKLIVVDPIGSFLGGGTDAHRDNEVRGLLAPIAMLAEKHGPAVLVVAHRRKSAGSIADDLALGSRAFTAIARSVWHLTRDSKNKARRLLLPGKNNLDLEGDGLAFSIIGEPPRIAWERDPVVMSADDALAAENQSHKHKPGPDTEALDAASEWLRSALAGGPRLAKDLLDEWRNGQGGSERTLKRAKQFLGVEAYRVEVPGPWWCKLPAKDASPTQDVGTWPSWTGARAGDYMSDVSSPLAELLADCDAQGIRLLPSDDDGLTIDAPQDALTSAFLDRLKAHKGELMVILCGGADGPDDRQFDNWTELHRPDGGLSWIHPNHADNDFHAIDLPDSCPTCARWDLWQPAAGDVVGLTPGTWRCFRCDPPLWHGGLKL